MKNKSNIMWGIILIILGIILAGKTTGLYDIDIFFKGWWTLFIIIPSIIGIISDKDKKNNIILLIVGILLLLESRNIIDFEIIWELLLPLGVIYIGINFQLNQKLKAFCSLLMMSPSNKKWWTF